MDKTFIRYELRVSPENYNEVVDVVIRSKGTIDELRDADSHEQIILNISIPVTHASYFDRELDDIHLLEKVRAGRTKGDEGIKK